MPIFLASAIGTLFGVAGAILTALGPKHSHLQQVGFGTWVISDIAYIYYAIVDVQDPMLLINYAIFEAIAIIGVINYWRYHGEKKKETDPAFLPPY